jgi:protocatechuate 3,4-dioxygenase beta subunit
VNFPRPPVSPLPPRDGDLARVRRRALLRRLRAPGAVLASAALAGVVVAALPTPRSPSSLQPVATASESAPAETPTPAVPLPTPTATVAPTVGPTATLAPVVPPTPAPTTDPATTPPPPPSQQDAWRACTKGGSGSTGPDITGVVVDEAGHPLPGISITSAQCSAGGYHSGVVADRTDAQGRFTITCLTHWAVAAPFAWYTGVRSSSADVGFAWLDGMYHVVPCGSTYRIVLPRAAAVTVQLVDDQDHPIAEAGHQVGLFLAEESSTPLVSLHTAADGTASFTGLRPGRYFLYESPHAYRYFDVTAGQTADLLYRSHWDASPTPTATETVTPTP